MIPAPAPTPAEGLDNLGITATGPLGFAAESLRRRREARAVATFHGDPAARPRDVGTARPEQLAYRAALPFGALSILAPWHPGSTPEDRARWSQECEAEARRRGWHTSRFPAWGPLGAGDLRPSPEHFDLWWPGEEA